MSRIPTAAEKAILRTQPFRSKLYLVVEKGTSLFTAKVNDPSIASGATVITYDGDTGEDEVLPGMTLFNKSLDALGNEKGSARIKSINTGTNQITIEPNSIDWKDDDDLLVDGVFRLYRILPRIVSGVVYEDYDKAYTNQNDKDKKKPVALMGSPRYAWTGEPINFYGWRSYAKARDASGKRYGISSYQWDFDGGTVVAGSTTEAGSPSSPISVKWSTPGERHVSLLVTDDNGNTHKAYRPVIVVDRPGSASPPYEKFEIESLEADWESGEWRGSIKVTGDATPSDFPNNALVILFSEDWYRETKQSIGGWFGQEDILLCAYVIEDSVRQNAETGDVTFEIASIVNQLKELDVWPLNFKKVDGTPSGWHEFKEMTIEDIFWHIVEEHTTLKNIADVFIWTGVSGGKRVDFFDATEASVYDQVDQQLLSAIFGHLVSSRYSSVHGNRNFNMLNQAQRLRVGRVMMNLEKQDRIDDLEIAGERHRDAVCQVDFIGFIYDANGDPIEVYSLAPENQKNFGRVEKQTGILLTGSTIAEAQDEANELAGLYLAYQNIRFPSVTVKLGNYRIFDPANQDLVGLAIQPGDTPRGYDWYDGNKAKEFIVRRVEFEIDHEGGYMTATLGLEASTWGKDGVAGDYPPIPPPDEPPDEPPPWYPPPSPADGKKVIIASYDYGLYVTDDIFASSPVWAARNNGLSGNGLLVNEFRLNPWDLDRALLLTEEGIHTGENVWDSNVSWTLRLTHAQARTLCGGLHVEYHICDIVSSICQEGLVFAAVARPSGVVANPVYVIRSLDGGINWTYRGQSTFNTADFGHTHYGGAEARGGKILCSTHSADRLWLQANRYLDESNDQGANFSNLNNALGYAERTGLRVPYHNNPNDDVMFVFGEDWTTPTLVRKSINHGSSFTDYSGPSGYDYALWKPALGVHTWGQQYGHAVVSNSGGANPSTSHLLTSDDGGETWTDRGQIPTFVPLGVNRRIWAHAGFPYDHRKHYCGRHEWTLEEDLEAGDPVMAIWVTQDRGDNWADATGNLYDDFGVLSVVGIVPKWTE